MKISHQAFSALPKALRKKLAAQERMYWQRQYIAKMLRQIEARRQRIRYLQNLKQELEHRRALAYWRHARRFSSQPQDLVANRETDEVYPLPYGWNSTSTLYDH